MERNLCHLLPIQEMLLRFDLSNFSREKPPKSGKSPKPGKSSKTATMLMDGDYSHQSIKSIRSIFHRKKKW